MDNEILEALTFPDAPKVWKGKSRVGPSFRERLMKGVRINPESDCWECSGRSGQRYPTISVGGSKAINRHRAMFYIHNGFMPDVVMHKCDNVICINPKHLIAGTSKENTKDMIDKGRGVFPDRLDQCKRGHALVDPNLYYDNKGGRMCRQCALDRAKGLYS